MFHTLTAVTILPRRCDRVIRKEAAPVCYVFYVDPLALIVIIIIIIIDGIVGKLPIHVDWSRTIISNTTFHNSCLVINAKASKAKD